MIRLFLLALISLNARAEVVFLDLNNAPEERQACEDGIQSGNITGEKREQMHVIDPKKRPRQKGESSLRSDTYHALREKLQDMIAKNIPVDSIVISGEDGSGEFFGSQGRFHYYELAELLRDFPQVSKTLKSAAVWGCYPSTVTGAEQFWLNKLPNMQFTMGFVTQGPKKNRRANHELLRQFCERRQEAAKATTMDQLCRFYDSLKQIKDAATSIGVCNRVGLVSREYAVGGKGEKCFTYQQLYDRCPSFIKDKKMQDIYDRHMNGDAELPEETEGKITELRRYYNEANKWRHCADKFKADREKANKLQGIRESERPTDMPSPASLVRLIKYNKLKSNIAKQNASELANYDESLERAGLGSLRVGDITQLSRKQLNDKITAAVTALNGQTVVVPESLPPRAPSARQTPANCGGNGNFMFSGCEAVTKPTPPVTMPKHTVRGVKDPTLLRMAQCMRQTFVNMNEECSPFDLIGDHPKSQSMCLMTYNEAKATFKATTAEEEDEDDAC